MVSCFPMRLGVAWASEWRQGWWPQGLALTFYDTCLPKGINIFYLDYSTYISNQRQKLLFLFFFFSGYIGCLLRLTGFSSLAWILVPEPGLKPISLALEGRIPNNWAIRKVPTVLFLHRLRKKILEPLPSGLSLVYIKNNIVKWRAVRTVPGTQEMPYGILISTLCDVWFWGFSMY